MSSETSKGNFQKGLPVGIGVGIAIGTALGVATDNMGLLGAGLAIGIGLAPVFGAGMNKKDDDRSGVSRPSEEEDK